MTRTRSFPRRNAIRLDFSSMPRTAPLGALLRATLRLIPPRTVLPVLQGPNRGMRWVTGSSTHGCWLGSYESEKQVAFARAIHAGDLIVDAGANVGFYTLIASRRSGANGGVIAFEPLPRNIGFLRGHLKLNGLTNVSIEPSALWSESGTVNFEDAGSPLQGRVASTGSTSVPAVTLDSFLDVWGKPPDVIKMDIEGGEVQALRGARVTLRRGVRVLFIETFGEAKAESLALLSDAGYIVESLSPGMPWDSVSEFFAVPR